MCKNKNKKRENALFGKINSTGERESVGYLILPHKNEHSKMWGNSNWQSKCDASKSSVSLRWFLDISCRFYAIFCVFVGCISLVGKSVLCIRREKNEGLGQRNGLPGEKKGLNGWEMVLEKLTNHQKQGKHEARSRVKNSSGVVRSLFLCLGETKLRRARNELAEPCLVLVQPGFLVVQLHLQNETSRFQF